MSMNSKLVDYTIKSPNNSGKRLYNVQRITIHCYVGNVTAEAMGNWFKQSSAQCSCNYGIDKNGGVLLCVDEENRSWCSSSRDNDNRAITIECASDVASPYTFNSKVYNKLLILVLDICQRYNFKKLIWIPDKEKGLSYNVKDGECLLSLHRWFANKSCPGEWFYERIPEFVKQVNESLANIHELDENTVYIVQCGVFKKKEYAKALTEKLAEYGFESLIKEVLKNDL